MEKGTLDNSAYCVEFFYAKPNCREKLKNALSEIGTKSRAEKGCLQYEVLTDKLNPDLFILLVKFSTPELMLQHEQQPFVTDFTENEMSTLCEKVEWYDAFLTDE